MISFLFNLNQYLNDLIAHFGIYTYLLLFMVLFCETGFIIAAFLPGDSLLFATGALAANGILNLYLLYIFYVLGTFLGDLLNYLIGLKIGTTARNKQKYISEANLLRAQRFYEKYGALTILLARFVPFVRTFVPFISGIGSMNRNKFLLYNLLGGFLWVVVVLNIGYYFGNLPFVRHYFSFVILFVILITVLSAFIPFFRNRKKAAKE